MRFFGSRSESAISQLSWALAYADNPAAFGLPQRKGALRPQPSSAFVLPVRQDFIRDPRLMPGTTRMLMLLAGWSGRAPDIHTTLGTIAKHLGRSQRYVKDAAEEGYLYYGYRKDRLGYITGLKIRLNPSAIFASRRSLPRPKNIKAGAENRAATLVSDTNENSIFYMAKIDEWDRKMMAMMDRNKIPYSLLE